MDNLREVITEKKVLMHFHIRRVSWTKNMDGSPDAIQTVSARFI